MKKGSPRKEDSTIKDIKHEKMSYDLKPYIILYWWGMKYKTMEEGDYLEIRLEK